MKLSVKSALILVCAAIVVAVGSVLLLDLFFGRNDQAEVAMYVEQDLPQLAETLSTEFPEDYQTLLTTLADRMREEDSDLPLAALFEAQRIASQYSGVALRADDEDVKAWIAAVEASLEAMVLRGGTELCANYVSEGPSALEGQAFSAFQSELELRDVRVFEAIAAARDVAPGNEIGEPLDADWALIDSAMQSTDISSRYADILLADDVSNPDFCTALAFYFHAINEMPGDAGMRIRNAYFAGAISN